MARLPIPGADTGTWGSLLNEYLLVSHESGGTLKSASVGDAQISSISQSKVTGLAAALSAVTVPDATTSTPGKVQLAGDLSGTATSPIVKSRPFNKVVANVGGDYTIDSSTDIASTVTAAISALTSGRTWVETVYLRGNFLIAGPITVPSYTRLVLDGTITTTTLRPSGATNWANNMGVFEMGDRTTHPTTRQCHIMFTPGSKVIGDYFNTNASSYPQDKYAAGQGGVISDSTIMSQLDVSAIHSYCTLIDCSTVDICGENLEGVVRFEALGRTNGTPSKGIRVTGTRGRYTTIVVEAYNNGYLTESIEIIDTYAEYCIDDIVAVIGDDGGASGATARMQGVTIRGVWGNKNGLRGSAVKVDGGDLVGGGVGSIRDVLVTDVNVRTNSATLSGYVVSENVVYMVLCGDIATRNIHFANVRGEGTWRFGLRSDMSGVDVSFNNFYVEAFYGMVLKTPIVPDDRQKVTVSNTTLVQRNGGETNSRGIAIMGGAGAQGFKNISLRNVRIHYFEKPLIERGISGLGADGTITNVRYDIDIMDKAISDLDLTSTNRTMTVAKFGQVIYQDVAAPLTLDTTNSRAGILSTVPTHSLTLGSTSTGLAIYNSTDQTTNYGRAVLNMVSNNLTLTTQKGGTGTLPSIVLKADTGVADSTLTVSRGGIPLLAHGFSSASAAGNYLSFTGAFSASSGVQAHMLLSPTISQTGTGGYTALLVNPTETTTGSGAKLLIDAQVGSTSKFRVSNTGSVVMASGATLTIGTPATYTATNVTTDRSYNADTVAVDELADVVGTLIADLRTMGLVL